MIRALKQDNGTWRVRLEAGKDENGKRVRKSFTGKTKKETEAKAQAYLDEQEKIAERIAAGPTVEEKLRELVSSKSRCLSPSTLKGYYTIINRQIDDIAQIPVTLLTQNDIQQWINNLAEEHSPKTCANAHCLLVSLLAIERPDMILRTRLPQKRKKSIFVPDADQVAEIGEKLQGSSLYVPFLLASLCGLRASEISGLTIDCVTEQGIVVKQARVDGVNGAEIKQPKSSAGYRTVPAPDYLIQILRETVHEDGHICTLRSAHISSRWAEWRQKQGLPNDFNFHALRHHFASQCLLLGMPQKYVAEVMGHSDTTMIDRVYQHTFKSAMNEFAQCIKNNGEKFFGKVNGTGGDKNLIRGLDGDKNTIKTA